MRPNILFLSFLMLAFLAEFSIAGKAVRKNGWLTKAVEVLPFGGVFTAPFHAYGRKGQEAVSSVVKGLTSGACLVAGLGPLGFSLSTSGSMSVGVVTGAIVDIPFTYVRKQGFRSNWVH